MHELGYAIEIIRTLEDFMETEHLSVIREVTLTVGEATGIVPRFMMECWPAAIADSDKIKDCELKIKEVKAFGECHNCDKQFPIAENKRICPFCGSEDYDMVTGYEFEISEIKGH